MVERAVSLQEAGGWRWGRRTFSAEGTPSAKPKGGSVGTVRVPNSWSAGMRASRSEERRVTEATGEVSGGLHWRRPTGDKAGTERMRTTGRGNVKKSHCAHENTISLTRSPGELAYFRCKKDEFSNRCNYWK